MAVKPEEVEEALIDTVCLRMREQLSPERAERCEGFMRQYYRWVPPQDLAGRSPLDLCGAAIAHWELARLRQRGATKLRVYNPQLDEHGWQSSHTVIEIVTDDMPFLVDSLRMTLNRYAYDIHLVIHPVIRVNRDADGRLLGVTAAGSAHDGVISESFHHIEIDRETELDRLQALEDNLGDTLARVRAAVEDWPKMRRRVREIVAELEHAPPRVDPRQRDEANAFLAWVDDDNFTFLGYREYDLVLSDGVDALQAVTGSGLGILRQDGLAPPSSSFAELPSRLRAPARTPQLLVLTKTSSRSEIHRPAYLDYIGVKRFGPAGEVVGERRFLGLYTTAAHRASPREIPILRGRVQRVLARADFPADSHNAKALVEILETYPREELFQIGADELFEVTMGILALGERQRVRLFVRRDPYERFLSCLVFIPRDRFNTENRTRVAEVLCDAFGAHEVDWSLQLSESVLVRVHYVLHGDGVGRAEFDAGEVEARLVEVTRSWVDDLRDALIEEHGEERGSMLYARYQSAFPTAYRAAWPARAAVADIAGAEDLLASGEELAMSLYRPREAGDGVLRCKLFSVHRPISLSDVLPMFENMAMRVADERPYEVTRRGGPPLWIYDFGLVYSQGEGFATDQVGELFQDAFIGVWRGDLENDGLNALVPAARLSGRDVTVLRAVAKYLRQGGIAFSDGYTIHALTANPEIARLLVELFHARFDPEHRNVGEAERLVSAIEREIDAVTSLDEDRILRNFLAVVRAILRSNYFQRGDVAGNGDGKAKAYLSFKLDSSLVPLLPRPRPQFEIFVYSPRVEGVHLRGGRVARGGLRWSDRREDFRTEVLGLMKAQMVKNALIVPVGAKGGFVIKRPPATGGREAMREEVVAGYGTFIRGLLDLTDNVVDGRVVPPRGVVRLDEDDTYLVVAADKGTATFSDDANAIAAEYRFWLGDAFASGGSVGYDHKQMGITARGAWESVKRHFRELGTDVQSADFTVVGIGDMSGDVFGNGMLLSPHTRLVGAFNHQHVFLDPDPDPEASFAERRRLFELPRSSWRDYDSQLISEGGGVFSRAAKSVCLSPQARAALGTDAEELTPNELIRVLLRAPVDLLWNGGIGTYVKSRAETHGDVGDKANDGVRIDAHELRCRVIGEGGNLGLTQGARIEYALDGGRVYTDAIDNAAGVNCSDHEVNIKILLDSAVAEGAMTRAERNELLATLTDAVAEAVLRDSYAQARALSLARAQAPAMIDVHSRFVRTLERDGKLDRELEFLPDPKTIAERKLAQLGFTAPELSIVLAYCKIDMYSSLLESDLPEDPYLSDDLARYFPSPLPERFAEQMRRHPLRREIIATHVTNGIVDRAGTTFAFRLGQETGVPPADLARGFAIAREVFAMRGFWSEVESLDDVIDSDTQCAMLFEARKLVERATRWLVRNRPRPIDIAGGISRYASGTKKLSEALPRVLDDAERAVWNAMVARLEDAAVPTPLAAGVASMGPLLAALDVVEIAHATRRSVDAVAAVHFQLGAQQQLHWLRDRIVALPRDDRWQALARSALRDDLNTIHRALTFQVLRASSPEMGVDAAIEAWVEGNSTAVRRSQRMLADIEASRTYDLTTLPVALREVRNLIQSTDLPPPHDASD